MQSYAESGSVPKTLEDSRRWLQFWNTTDETIPPFACVWVVGKRFGGRGYTDKNLPKDGDPSYNELQKEIGYRKLLLLGYKPFQNFKWGLFNHSGFYFNGPTPVPPRSWGRCNADYPTIARVRSVAKAGNRLLKIGEGGYYFRPQKDSWDLVDASGTDSVWDGRGWGSGWGWGGAGFGNRWGYAAPPLFWLTDMIDCFDKTEGLVWIKPGLPPATPDGFLVLNDNALSPVGNHYASGPNTIDDGHNDVGLTPLAVGSRYEGVSPAVGDVIYDAGWLTFRTPGIYSFDLDLAFSAIASGPAADGENPWAQLSIEAASSGLDGVHLSTYSTLVTLAPPVLKQGAYGVDTTYISYYTNARMLVELVIDEPEDYNPTDEDLPVLAEIKLDVYRTSNDADGLDVTMAIRGFAKNSGLNAADARQTSDSKVSP